MVWVTSKFKALVPFMAVASAVGVGSGVSAANEPNYAPHDRAYLIENETNGDAQRYVVPPRSREEALAFSADEFDVKGVAERYGLTEAQSVTRLSVEQASLGLPTILQRSHPSQFAGVWLSESSNPYAMVKGANPNVTVALSESSLTLPELREELANDFAFPERLRLLEVPYSSAELGSMLTQLVAVRDLLQGVTPAGGSSVPPDQVIVDALKFTGGSYGVGEDAVGNRVVVVIDGPARAAEDLEAVLAMRLGRSPERPLPIDVQFGDSSPTSSNAYCPKSNCQWEFMGGLKTEHGSDPHCTSGFPMWLGGARAGSAAGHCHTLSSNVGEWRTNGPSGHVGTVNVDVRNGPCDVEVFKHTANPWAFSSWIHLGPEPRRDIDHVNPVSNYPIGVTVGMSGVSTGSTAVRRGPISTTNYSPSWVPSGHSFIVADYFEQSGDSGAPVFRNDEAWGLHAGNTVIDLNRQGVFMRAEYMESCTGADIML